MCGSLVLYVELVIQISDCYVCCVASFSCSARGVGGHLLRRCDVVRGGIHVITPASSVSCRRSSDERDQVVEVWQ